MSALKSLKIVSLDAFHIAIPLVNPYHLSKVYGTQTHSDVIIVRIMTDSGEEGWGEADPGGVLFTGDTAKRSCNPSEKRVQKGSSDAVLTIGLKTVMD